MCRLNPELRVRAKVGKKWIVRLAYFSPMKFYPLSNGQRVAYSTYQKPTAVAEQSLPPLVLLHGFCEDQFLWEPLLPFLNSSFLIRIDLPGFGASDAPVLADMSSYAEAVLGVLKAEDISSCILIGHSLGGYVGLEFATKWPGYLAGLGLFHSHPFEDSEERKTVRHRGIETLQAGKRDLYVSQLFPNLFAPDFLAAHPETVQHVIHQGKKQSVEGIIAALQAMISRRDHTGTLRLLNCPALFLLGELDALIPPKQGIEAALLPSASALHVLPEVAHMGMWEAPETCAEVLNSFLKWCYSYCAP